MRSRPHGTAWGVPPPRTFAPPASFGPGPSRAQKQDDRRWSEWQEASSRVYEDAQAAVRLTGTMYKDNKQFGFLMQDKTREEIFVLPLRSQDFSDFSVTGEITKRTPKYGFIMSEECDDRILVIPSNCPGFGGELPPLGAVVTCTVTKQRASGSNTDAYFALDVHPAKPDGADDRYTGVIEGDHGNYGFIRCDQHPDHNHDKMFVLPWSCEGGEMFEIGTPVSFSVVEDRKTGRPRAEDVVRFSGLVPSASGAPGSRVPREPSHPPKARREQRGSIEGVTVELRRGQFARDNGTFGFIQPDGNGGDVFVLPSQFEGGVFPAVGTRLAFKVAPDAGRQGERPKCTDVRILQAPQVVSHPNPKPSSSPATPWQRARKWEAPEAQTPTPLQSKREACALMWRQFCDAEGEGVYDPEEHGAPFLRRFVKTLLHPENGQQPPSKYRRTT